MRPTQLRPILASLKRHKLSAGLVVVQVALTCAIVLNAGVVVVARMQRIATTTGLPENALALVSVRGLDDGENHRARQALDLQALRRVDGVQAAVEFGAVHPLSGGAEDKGTCSSEQALAHAMELRSINVPGCIESTYYKGSPGFVAAMGARLVAGRDFLDAEYTEEPDAVILTQSLAKALFPDGDALGKPLYAGGPPRHVVGIVKDLLRPRLRDRRVDHLVTLAPMVPQSSSATYLLRTAPGMARDVLPGARSALAAAGPARLLPESQSLAFADVRQAFFKRDTTMVSLLLASMLSLLFVTALGISGLASFWVQQRIRQIGIRRALGATRREIRHYFQVENLVLSSLGMLPGLAMAYALNAGLQARYGIPPLPPLGVAAVVLVLWVIGQCAVAGAARRAARIAPATASRTV